MRVKRTVKTFYLIALVMCGCLNGLLAQNSNVVIIQCGWNEENFANLDASAKTSGKYSYGQFKQSLMKEPQIMIQDQSSDIEIRKLQLKSQKEASIGMGSDDAAYAQDKRSRASLGMRFSMFRTAGNLWKLSVLVFEPETMNVIADVGSDSVELNSVADDVLIDKLAYQVLEALQNRKYIKPMSVDVAAQLLHKQNSDEVAKKIIDSYLKQEAEADEELKRLQEKKMSGEERLEAEAQERALRLKKEMAERNRRQAEEEMRRQKEEAENAAKQKAELDKVDAKKRDEILQYQLSLSEKFNEIRKQNLSTVSLKKRIELIEQQRRSLAEDELQLEANIRNHNSEIFEQMWEKVGAKETEPWGIADLSNGFPTEIAKARREKEIQEIRQKYEKIAAADEKEFRASAAPLFAATRKQIASDILELEKGTYTLTSIKSDPTTSPELVLTVGAFDGLTSQWPIYVKFNLLMPKSDLSKVDLSTPNISYQMMSGKKLSKKMTSEEYDEYRKSVERIDEYFRFSVPYLYAKLVVTVKYDSKLDMYIFKPEVYQIFITERDERAIYEKGGILRSSSQASNKALTGKYVKSDEEKQAIYKKTGRQGIHGSAGYAFGAKDSANFNGFEFGGEILFPIHKKFRWVYFGAEASYLVSGIEWSDKHSISGVDYYLYNNKLYKASGAKTNFNLFSANAVLGGTVTLAKFICPYIQVEGGGCFGDVSGLDFNITGGCDFRVWKIVVGPEARVRFAPNGIIFGEFGVSGGFVW